MTTKIPVELSSTPGIVDGSNATAITIDSSENVGIGETSPDLKLHVKSSGQIAKLETTASTGDCILTFADASANKGFVGFGSSSSEIFQITNIENGDMKFDTNNTERMRIDSAGNVGIGTTSPSRPLEVTGSATDFSAEIKVNNSSSASGAHGSIQFVTEGESTGLIIGKHSSGFSEADLAFVFNELNTAMQFGTNNTERMRIDSSGNLLINATSRQNTGSRVSIKPVGSGVAFETQPSDSNAYYVALFFNNSSAVVGSIYSSTSSTSFNTSSDYRLKENVIDMDNAINRVKQLKPKRFNFIVDADKTVDGFLAHEVSDIVPEAITGEKDGTEMQQIDHSKLVPLLTKAIQEQQVIIEDLQTQINEVKNGN